jgi:TolB-like protein
MKKSLIRQRPRFGYWLGIAALASALCGCSSTGSRSGDQPTLKKEVRDVSPQARKSEESSPRKRLMILPFLDTGDQRPQSLRDQARKEVIRGLNKTGEVIVVDSNDLKLDMTRHLQSGEYKLEEVAKLTQELGVSAVLEGKIMELKVRRKSDEVGVFRQLKTTFDCVVRVRIASSRSGKELFNTTKTVTIEESNVRVAEAVDTDRFFMNNPEVLQHLVEDSFLEFTQQIVATMDKLAWEGRIAMVNGDRIFLNVGRISGLQVGDILRVSEEGDEVFDPQNGGFIGKGPGRLKGTLEVVSYFGQDGSIAVVHSGAGFKENDRVELY